MQAAGETEVAELDRSSELSDSVKFDLLSNERRRYLLQYLLEEPQISVRDLSRQVAAWENDVDPDAVTWRQRKRVYSGLHQTHLPRLDDYDVIEYDSDRGEVRPGSAVHSLKPYLDTVGTEEPWNTGGGQDRILGWGIYYTALGIATMILSAGILVGMPFLSDSQLAIGLALIGIAVLAGAAIEFRDEVNFEVPFTDD